MNTKIYRVTNCEVENANFDRLAEAFLTAHRNDGWGACFARDEYGDMRIFTSKHHIGNNAYSPKPGDAWPFWSDLEDDSAAEDDVARQMLKVGYLEIMELTYDNGVLVAVDGKDLNSIREEFLDDEMTVEKVREMYA